MCSGVCIHILKLVRQREFPISSACARWVLFQISFRPQKEVVAKLGEGRTIIMGPFSRHYGKMATQLVSSLCTNYLSHDTVESWWLLDCYHSYHTSLVLVHGALVPITIATVITTYIIEGTGGDRGPLGC